MTDKKIYRTKYWSFTWSTCVGRKKLPGEKKLKQFFDIIADEAVFQKEVGNTAGKLHYQGGFILKGSRKFKKNVLDIFEEFFNNVLGLSLQPAHNIKDVFVYCSKDETRASETCYAGYKEKYDMELASMELRPWQKDLFSFIKLKKEDKEFRDRKIIWVEDKVGNTGKSAMLKFLRVGQKDLRARKLSVNSVDRLISAVTKVTSNEEIDLFMIDFTRTKGKDQNYEDLFAAIEDIKNGYVVDMMYGKYEEAIFRPPMILIFTNQTMCDYEKYLSQDRWVRLVINSSKELEEWVSGIEMESRPPFKYITPYKVRSRYLEDQVVLVALPDKEN